MNAIYIACTGVHELCLLVEFQKNQLNKFCFKMAKQHFVTQNQVSTHTTLLKTRNINETKAFIIGIIAKTR